MAFNYQRHSYTLWESANRTYQDPETRFVFESFEVLKRSFFRSSIGISKVALQKNKQTEIWIRLYTTFIEFYHGIFENFLIILRMM